MRAGEQHFHEGGLPGAVRAQQSERGSPLDAQGDILHRAELLSAPAAAKRFRQPFCFDGYVHSLHYGKLVISKRGFRMSLRSPIE